MHREGETEIEVYTLFSNVDPLLEFKKSQLFTLDQHKGEVKVKEKSYNGLLPSIDEMNNLNLIDFGNYKASNVFSVNVTEMTQGFAK